MLSHTCDHVRNGCLTKGVWNDAAGRALKRQVVSASKSGHGDQMNRLQAAGIASLVWTVLGGTALLLGLLAVESHKRKAGLNPAALNTLASPDEPEQ